MNSQLPIYKKTFMVQMQHLRKQKVQDNNLNLTKYKDELKNSEGQKQNVLWVGSQYSSNQWRSDINRTYYKHEHNVNNFEISGLLNPQIKRKQHNMRVTQISQYSNARFNNNVFINPKNTSC